MAKIGPVEYGVGAIGAALLLAAIANRNPLDVARAALTGQGTVRPLRVPADPAPESDAPPASDPGAGPAPAAGQAPPALAAVSGNPGHRLIPPAASAFAQWQTIYGRPIPITDSYRSYDHQARQHAADPDRFSAPDRSWHVRGRAVDVNLPALGIGSTISDPGYRRLYDAARAAGWDTYSNGVSGHTWHFSWGGRG